MKQIKKLSPANWLLLILFFLVLVTPSLFFFLDRDEILEEENRVAADKPLISWETLELFPQQYEAYLNDSFPLRAQYLNAYGNIKYYLLGDSASTDYVRGKNGWSFYETTVNRFYKGYQPFTQSQLENAAGYLNYVNDLLEARGASFYVMIAPNTISLYPEYAPSNIKTNEEYDNLDTIESYLLENGNFHYVSAKQSLLAQKENYEELYYPRGTHWNSIGAYYSYEALMREIQKDRPQLKIIDYAELRQEPTDIDRQKTLYEKRVLLDVPANQAFELVMDRYYASIDKISEVPSHLMAEGRYIYTESEYENVNDNKIVVFHDSFLYYSIDKFLSNSFAQAAYYSRTYQLTEEHFDFENIQPGDIVFLEIVERNVHDLYNKEYPVVE